MKIQKSFAIGTALFVSGYMICSAEPGRADGGQNVIRIASVPGAQCTLSRDGAEIRELAISKNGQASLRTEILTIDVGSQHDITVTCHLDGYETASKTLVWGKVSGTMDSPPCMPPPNADEQTRDDICKSHVTGREIVLYRYPIGVNVPLQRSASKNK